MPMETFLSQSDRFLSTARPSYVLTGLEIYIMIVFTYVPNAKYYFRHFCSAKNKMKTDIK